MKRIFICLIILSAMIACQDDRYVNKSKTVAPSMEAIPTGSQNTLSQPSEGEAVIAAAPVPSFKIRPRNGNTDTVFTFDASGTKGNVKKYRWKFGDGTYDKGVIVKHKYQSGGTFDVKLVVTNDAKEKGSLVKTVTVQGNSPPDDEKNCSTPAPNRGLIFGTVVGVEGFDAIVQLPAGSTCANSFYYCGDMRRSEPTEQFRGIIKRMRSLGSSEFAIFNDCPFKWPPAIGEREFLYWKRCSENYCP
jgi:hypothetical protein